MDTLHQLTAVTATTPTKPKPPCAARPDDWDIDIGSPDVWHHAVRICEDCPLLAECRELVVTLAARGIPPRSMIWAGVGYDGSGQPIEDLGRHRTRPIEHKQPLRIVRTGPAYARRTGVPRPDHDSCTSARRTIILRRRQLPPTGTGTG